MKKSSVTSPFWRISPKTTFLPLYFGVVLVVYTFPLNSNPVFWKGESFPSLLKSVVISSKLPLISNSWGLFICSKGNAFAIVPFSWIQSVFFDFEILL